MTASADPFDAWKLEWPFRIMLSWAKMARPLYSFISQSLNWAPLVKGVILGKAATDYLPKLAGIYVTLYMG